MKKIVYFFLGQQGGGTAIDALEMALGLSKYGKILCVISSVSDSYCKWIKESENNPNLVIIGVKTSKNLIWGSLLLLNIFNNVKLILKIRKFAPDVVFSYMGHPYESVIIPFVKCKIKAQGVHDVKLHDGETSIIQSILGIMLNYKVSHYVVFSNFSYEEMRKQGVPGSKILQTFLGCNSKLMNDRRLDLKCYNQFLFFGRLIKYKGIDVLFNSLKKVFEKYPGSKLIVAGRGDITMYMDCITKYKNNIEIHNKWIADEDIPLYFKNVDFVVAPYTDATQSGVVPLSYSFGKPVIASNSGGLPEQVVEGSTGLIVEAGDSKMLSEAIIKMIDDKERLMMMKKGAFEYFNEMTWDAASQKLYDEFEIYLNAQKRKDGSQSN